MINKQIANRHLSFKPLSSLTLITDDGNIEISAGSVTAELVGEKAFGLSCLPKPWTLPFIVVSNELLSLWNSSSEDNRGQLLKRWAKQIFTAAVSIGINEEAQIIVRSSGHSEGLDERGMFYSIKGTLSYVMQPLTDCLQRLSSDKDLNKQKVPLVIQKCAVPISAKGHLSNERRFYKEKRDWLGDFEKLQTGEGKPFKINLRKWRKLISVEDKTDKPLWCNLTAHVSKVLKIPAAWAYDRKLRLHYEWVWDGKSVYIVQADQEHETAGIEPTTVSKLQKSLPPKFTPKYLKEINESHANKYEKIRNVFKYLKLGLPTTKLYVLDDQSVIDALASGTVSPSLEKDLSKLVKGSLVIRMDIATEDINMRKLLPRSDEMRELDRAVVWLKEQSAEIRRHVIDEDVVFIFHNFVPSVSSAFALATPGERLVQIEALWGLPEGLYYNKHDKFIVDTLTPRLEEIRNNDIDRFKIREKIHFKKFFVTPDKDGHWATEILMPSYGWRKSIRRTGWVKEIAFESRRIAEEEGKALSIMWFVGVPKGACSRPILPWYHEHYDQKITSRALTHRTKTPFDKSLIIKTNEDIEVLRKEAEKKHPTIRRVRIQPHEEKLLRNKDALGKIGKLTQQIDAIILLEGGVLSHAYYQLMQTNAIVEVLHPFGDFEDRREFNKLVRDKVPSTIERGGEVVSKARLLGEYLLRALREKLIEEVFEVLDAVDQESIVDELADVIEIVDEIISQLGVSRAELLQRQDQKRERSGGFKDGLVLLKTENPLPTKRDANTGTLFGDFSPSNERDIFHIDGREVIKLNRTIDKWSDRREHQAASESILSLEVPMARDSWEAHTTIMAIESCSDNDTHAKVKITGKRQGSKLKISLSIFTPQKQLKLF